jgi:rhamnogalacturonyl hydrolase YesR
MTKMIENAFRELKDYCEKEQFKGWDPYDGLNSRLFNATPLKHSAFFRWAWIQVFKKNPVNLRPLALIDKGFNPKGVALFLSAYSNLVRMDPREEHLSTLTFLADTLLSLRSTDYPGACWGYNFDWQGRMVFLFPRGTPTVVATSYAVNGLLDAYEVTKKEEYLSAALSSANFVTHDLLRTPSKKGGFYFSYSPTGGMLTVYNASLLGSRLLARVYHYTGDKSLLGPARDSVLACVNAQQENGSWYYGELPVQNWIDSFHTGFNLESISDYQKFTGDFSFQSALEKGLEFYLNHFFCEDGMPKYYAEKTYPIDIHSPAQLIITLFKLGKLTENKSLANKVMTWTLENMKSDKGYFYYQVDKFWTSKIPYMRWSQAWIMYALSLLLLNEFNHGNK